jgi:hypothetical protein
MWKIFFQRCMLSTAGDAWIRAKFGARPEGRAPGPGWCQGQATVNQHPPVHYQGWMICDEETVICRVQVFLQGACWELDTEIWRSPWKTLFKVLCMAWQRMLQSYQHKSNLIYTKKIWWLFLYYWTGPGGPIPPGNVSIPVWQAGICPALYSRTSITKSAIQKITTYPPLGLFQNSDANSVASGNISESISLQSDTIAKLAFFNSQHEALLDETL